MRTHGRLIMYYIYDETGELMRKVRFKAEAIQLVKIREGWSYVYVKQKKKFLDVNHFEESPF